MISVKNVSMVKTPKLYVETFGCSLNLSDTEFIIGEFLKKGFKLSSFEEADVIVINTCGVKEHTENKIITYLKKINSLNKKKIIAGCLTKINLERIKKAIPSFNLIISPSSYAVLNTMIDKIIAGETGLILLEEHPPKLNRDFQIKEKIGIVPIAYGCLGECSYCCVRFARG
ncbi:MAG: hypothetical protein ACTSQY_08695, partial [Candidatus Odinarchaeia archaeon]